MIQRPATWKNITEDIIQGEKNFIARERIPNEFRINLRPKASWE